MFVVSLVVCGFQNYHIIYSTL